MTQKLHSVLLLSSAVALTLPFAAMAQTDPAAVTTAATTKTGDLAGAAAKMATPLINWPNLAPSRCTH